MEALVEEFVTVVMPEDFFGVGQWYNDFRQVSDECVYELLQRGAKLQTKEAV
jgi:predicted phosphoribosyltransferase